MNKLIIYMLYAGIIIPRSMCRTGYEPSSCTPPSLPVIKINPGNATTWLEYPATIEGTTNVEIRPQVSGYLKRSLWKKALMFHKGQPLFRINSKEYSEFSNNASASIQAANAAIEKAQVEYDRLNHWWIIK